MTNLKRFIALSYVYKTKWVWPESETYKFSAVTIIKRMHLYPALLVLKNINIIASSFTAVNKVYWNVQFVKPFEKGKSFINYSTAQKKILIRFVENKVQLIINI